MDAAYLCFLLCGAAQLFPWCALITACDWWSSRYQGWHTDRLLTACYLPADLAVVAVMIACHGRVRPRLRVVAGLLGFTAAMLAVALLNYAPPSPASLAAVLALVALCGCCDGLMSGALFGEAASLAPRYSQAVMAGTAVSGVAVCLLRIVTKATLPDTPAGLRQSASLYFVCAAAACLACALLYGCVLPQLAEVRRRKEAALGKALLEADAGWETEEEAEDGWETEGDGKAGWRAGGSGSRKPLLPTTCPAGGSPSGAAAAAAECQLSGKGKGLLGSPLQHQHGQEQEEAGSALKAWQPRSAPASPPLPAPASCKGKAPLKQPLLVSPERSPPQHTQRRSPSPTSGRGSPALGGGSGAASCSGPLSAMAVFRRVWQLALANTLLFTVTLSIFPGVLAEDVHDSTLGSWFPVLLITAFNLGDWAGKSLPGWRSLRLRGRKTLLALALLRALFVPGFRLAALRHAGPAVVFALAASLGLSNGYLLVCSMVQGPGCVPPVAASLAGNILVMSIVVGLTCGAACSFLWLLFPLPGSG